MAKAFNDATKEGVLAACLSQVEASKEWFSRRALPLTLDQLRWRRGPGAWSIVECVHHLNLSLAGCLPKIDEAIGRGWRELRTRDGHSELGWLERQVLKRVEPPGSSLLAWEAIMPMVTVDPDELVNHFLMTRHRYAQAVRRAVGLDLPRIPILEPIHPLIQSLGGTLALLAAHERRYIWQAEQVRTAPGFPKFPPNAWHHRQDDAINPQQETL